MIHAIIKAERRVSTKENPRQLALAIDTSTRDSKGKVLVAKEQLHTMGERIDDASNITYAAEWDGKAPYVVVTVGNLADIKMAYMGWPMVDEATWRAANP